MAHWNHLNSKMSINEYIFLSEVCKEQRTQTSTSILMPFMATNADGQELAGCVVFSFFQFKSLVAAFEPSTVRVHLPITVISSTT